MIFKATPIPFASIIKVPAVRIGTLNISGLTIVTLAVTIVAMIILTWFINNTRMGRAMRAVSEDKGAAELMGINVNQTISVTFAIGSGLAAVAGILFICQYETLLPTLGALPGIKAFVAAVLGGIGSIPGRYARWSDSGYHRKYGKSLYFHAACGCHRFWCTGYRASGKTVRTSR